MERGWLCGGNLVSEVCLINGLLIGESWLWKLALQLKLVTVETSTCYQQSSTDIWHAICAAVKAACSLANISGEDVSGIGFAATCSLGLSLLINCSQASSNLKSAIIGAWNIEFFWWDRTIICSCSGCWWFTSNSFLEWRFKKKYYSLDGSQSYKASWKDQF